MRRRFISVGHAPVLLRRDRVRLVAVARLLARGLGARVLLRVGHAVALDAEVAVLVCALHVFEADQCTHFKQAGR